MANGNRWFIGQFAERDSVLHRLDPRTKLLGTLLLMSTLLAIRGYGGYGSATCIVLGILAASRVPMRLYLRGLLPMLPILLFTLLYHVLLGRGESTIAAYGILSITTEGIEEGVRIVWRILLMILLASTLTATTAPLRLARGLETLMKPLSRLRVPVEQFALMIVIAIRFIPTILEEADRIQVARQARGFVPPSARHPFGRMLSLVPVLVPLLAAIVRRADNLTMAIEARAYGDGRGRSAYRPLRLTKRDGIAAAVLLLLAVCMVLIDRAIGR